MKIARKYRRELAGITDSKFPGQKKELLRKTEIQYEKFMSEIPDIGGKKNMQFEDLNFAVVVFSFYEACGKKLTPDDLDAFADRTMVEPARKSGKFMNWNMPAIANGSTDAFHGHRRKNHRVNRENHSI